MPRRHRMEVEIYCLVPNLVTVWKLVVSCTLSGKSPMYPLNRRLGGSQICYGCFGEEENLLAQLELKCQIVQPVSQSQCTLSWLHLVQEVAVNSISTYAPLRWSFEKYTYVAGKMLIRSAQSHLFVVVCDSFLFWHGKHYSVILCFAH